jgi:hypothetical protein
MLSGLWYAEEMFSVRNRSIAWLPKWLVMLGVESLFVYMAHLIILCGWVTNTEFNFRHWFGGKLGIVESSLVFFCLTLMMIFSSFAWRYVKKRHPVLMTVIVWWMGFCVAWSFLMNPY